MRHSSLPGSVGVHCIRHFGTTAQTMYEVISLIQDILRILEVWTATRGRTMNWYWNVGFDPLVTWRRQYISLNSFFIYKFYAHHDLESSTWQVLYVRSVLSRSVNSYIHRKSYIYPVPLLTFTYHHMILSKTIMISEGETMEWLLLFIFFTKSCTNVHHHT